MNEGKVIWITGLSGSGKTTLASGVVRRLREMGRQVVLLDGDELREIFGATTVNTKNHGRTGRLALAMQYAHLCKMLSSQGMTVVMATISLFKEVHAWNRKNLPDYYEVFLRVPLEELRRRDTKGIYYRYDSGELSHVAGLDLSVDEPDNPDWVVEYSPEHTVEWAVEKLLSRLMRGNTGGN